MFARMAMNGFNVGRIVVHLSYLPLGDGSVLYRRPLEIICTSSKIATTIRRTGTLLPLRIILTCLLENLF